MGEARCNYAVTPYGGPSLPCTQSNSNMGTVIEDYEAKDDDELTVIKGDVVEIRLQNVGCKVEDSRLDPNRSEPIEVSTRGGAGVGICRTRCFSHARVWCFAFMPHARIWVLPSCFDRLFPGEDRLAPRVL